MTSLLLLVLACAVGIDVEGAPHDDETPGLQLPVAALPMGSASERTDQPVGGDSCVRDHALVAGTVWPSLQQAVDAAITGATVTVCDGVFQESLHLTRDITLRSEHGLGFSFMVGSGKASVISVEGASVTLEGLDLTSGGGDPWKDPQGGTVTVGGAVFAADAPLLRLQSMRIHHNEAQRGGGLFTVDVTRVELVDVELTANSADERGGSGSIAGGEVVAERVWVRLSDAPTGGGLALDRATATFTDLVLEDCAAVDDGGGLVLTETELTLIGGTLTGNSADYGAAVNARGGSLTADATTRFADNDGGTSGGALFLHTVDLVLSGTTLTGNQADHGGAAYLLGGTALLDGAVLDGNAAYRGGALYVTDGAAVTADGGAEITHNTADAWAGGLAVFGDATLDAPALTLAGNVAPYGGGLLASEVHCAFGPDTQVRDNVALTGGGGLYANAATLEGHGMLVSGNEAPLGGGVLLEIDAAYVSAGDRIVDNEADEGAGLLIYAGSTAHLEDVEVARNVATESGGGAQIHASAGGLSCLDCDWGDGAQDNGPQDIVHADLAFAAPPTFTCDEGGCSAD